MATEPPEDLPLDEDGLQVTPKKPTPTPTPGPTPTPTPGG